MLSLFGFMSISLAFFAICATDNKKEAGLTVVSLLLFLILSKLNAQKLDEYYYILVMLVDLCVLVYATNKNLNLSISVIFFISIMYNALSFIEFNTSSAVIYNSYEGFNKILISCLVISLYISGIKRNGTSSDDKYYLNIDNSSDSSFQARHSL